MNYKTLRNTVLKLPKGDSIYINAINLSENGIDTLKTLVKKGEIMPLKGEVQKIYKDVESVMKGDTILPQMMYVRI